MCHAEAPCLICSILLLITIQISVVAPLKFNYQSLQVRNGKGSLVARIPVQGIVSRNKDSTIPGQEEHLQLLQYKGDGCDLAELRKSFVQMGMSDGRNGEDSKSLVILNTLNCDLATKITHSHLARISTVLLHNLATNENPSGIVLEASDVLLKDHPINVFFTGYKYGHLIIDTFMPPNKFYVTVKPIAEDFFLIKDESLKNEDEKRKRQQKTRNRSSHPAPTTNSFASMIYSERELESFLETHLYFPAMAAFFGGMILWMFQIGTLLALIFSASFLIISIAFGLIYYYPLKFFGEEEPTPNADSDDNEGDNVPGEEINEELLNRLMQIYQVMAEDEFATAPLSPEKIASLQKIILNETEGAEIGMCGICEELYQAGGEVTKLLPSCTHLFHTICIEPWLKMASSCPLCRRLVTGNLHPDANAETESECEVKE